MSSKYKFEDRIPNEVLCERLTELSHAISDGKESFEREFTMRIPAEMDRDADIILAKSSRLIKELEKALREAMGWNWLAESVPPPEAVIKQCEKALS